MYAMAHALDTMVMDVCKNPSLPNKNSRPLAPLNGATTSTVTTTTTTTEAPPPLCPELAPTPPGADLLQYIRNVSFTSKTKASINLL